jgi:hypothetical protein
VTEAQPTINDEIERYLRTGGVSDPYNAAWPGGFMARANRAHDDYRGALVRAVRRLAEGRAHQPLPAADIVLLTRSKVEPMVRGLFPRAEQDAVLATIEQSVVFLTSANIEPLLFKQSFDGSAWTLANLYLASLGAELLGTMRPAVLNLLWSSQWGGDMSGSRCERASPSPLNSTAAMKSAVITSMSDPSGHAPTFHWICVRGSRLFRPLRKIASRFREMP